MISEEGTVLDNCRVLCIGVVCCIPTDQKSSRKTKPTWIQCIGIVVESRAVVVMKKAVDKQKLLTLRSCKSTVSIIPMNGNMTFVIIILLV